MVVAVARILDDRRPLVRNASVAATELIREAIIDGRLEPGQRLKEEELARELGISRTPIREALLMLQAEGLVDAIPEPRRDRPLAHAEDLDDLYQLRALLEGYAARRAATRISDERARGSCARAASASTRSIRTTDAARARQARTSSSTARSSRPPAARGSTAMVRQVIELPLVYKSYIWYSPDQKRISAHYHRQITTALAARDAERAELVMKEHVFEARDLLVAHCARARRSAG